jgi:hypothetical protein
VVGLLGSASALSIGCGSKKASAEMKVRCQGINECAGHGSCAGPNGCAGKNSCKGQGFLEVSEQECMQKGGKVVAKK